MSLVVPNPNWAQLFAEATFGTNAFYLANASAGGTDITARLYKSWSVRRGKQFELDQVQPAEFHGQWANRDGYLDPVNTSGPLSGFLLPFRGYSMRAHYPPSINLLDTNVATGGEGLAAGASSVLITSNYGNPTSTVSGTAWQGTRVWQVSVGASAATPFFLLGLGDFSAAPNSGDTYTLSMRVRCLTTGANPQVLLSIVWLNADSSSFQSDHSVTTTLTGSPSAGWTTLTFTDTMPTPGNKVTVSIGLELVGTSPSIPWVFQADGLQWEKNSTASTFSVPGVNYPIFSGLIERYPQSWDYNGTYGLVNPVAVDAMGLLSQTILKESLVNDINTYMPNGVPQWFFQLNDASGATLFAEQDGRTPPAGLYSSASGAGTLTPGNSIQAAGGPGGSFFGTNGPVITVSNPTANQGTVVDLTQAGITGPPSSGGWSRMLAFRTSVTTGTPIMAAATTGFNPAAVGLNSNWYLGLQGGATANVVVNMYTDAGVNAGVVNTGVVVNDNNWHLAIFTLDATGTVLTLWVDGVKAQTTGAPNMHTALTVNDSVGGDAYKNAGFVSYGVPSWQGDLALYAQWGYELSSGDVSVLYQGWRSAHYGDGTTGRYVTILNWSGFVGSLNADNSTAGAVGYANDVANVDVLTALQNVVDTEVGRHFIGSDGTLNFQSRQRFFQQGAYLTGNNAPMWVFGENQAGGEIPYTDLSFDYDPTRISNQIQVTQNSSSTVFTASDTTSQLTYGTRNLSRNSQALSAEEVREHAYLLLSRYKDVHLRVQALKINVAANPALWASALSFELGQYVQINRRDQFGVRSTITMYGFIEQITHSGDDKGAWVVELEVSPAPPVPYASFTSLRTTLHTQANSGSNSIVINALPDAATNPVQSELTGGQQLILINGGTSETATIATGGVPNLAAGYSTATITLTANLANTYPVGAAVDEGTGLNYDAFAVFDSALFSF